MKKIISISIVFCLLLSILTACGKNNHSSITSSTHKTEGMEQTIVDERDLRLDTVTIEVPGTDTQAVYSYKYYENYIECNLGSNVYNTIYYDKDLKTAYIANYGDSIDDIKRGEWSFSVTYDDNDKIVSFGMNGGISSYEQYIVNYENENQISLNNAYVNKSPEGDQRKELGMYNLEFKEDTIIFGSVDYESVFREYVVSNSKIVNYTDMISGETYEHSLEYDKSGALSKTTKKSSELELIASFSYSNSENSEVWHSLATILKFPTLTDMMVYLLTMQRCQSL